MPRNRMIKPDFWSDGNVVKLSFPARLLFIAMWNFADDKGVLENIDRKLLGDIFPFDECIDECVFKKYKQEIYSLHFFKLVEQKGKTFIVLKNFAKHQKIDKPSKNTYLDYSMPINEVKIETLPDSIDETLLDSIDAEREREREVEKEKEKINKKEIPTSDEVSGLFYDYLKSLMTIENIDKEKTEGQIRAFIRYYIGDEDQKGKWILAKKGFNPKSCVKNWIDKNINAFKNFKKPDIKEEPYDPRKFLNQFVIDNLDKWKKSKIDDWRQELIKEAEDRGLNFYKVYSTDKEYYRTLLDPMLLKNELLKGLDNAG